MRLSAARSCIAAVTTIALCAEASAAADARPKAAPAKGTKECVIGQYTSEYLESQYKQNVQRAGVPFYGKTSSYLKFRVARSGALTVSIAAETYPGTKFYFMIDGKRYSGEARYQLPLDAKAVAALKQDKLIDFTYTGWPDRNEMSRKDIFSDFAKAHRVCVEFLRS